MFGHDVGELEQFFDELAVLDGLDFQKFIGGRFGDGVDGFEINVHIQLTRIDNHLQGKINGVQKSLEILEDARLLFFGSQFKINRRNFNYRSQGPIFEQDNTVFDVRDRNEIFGGLSGHGNYSEQ